MAAISMSLGMSSGISFAFAICFSPSLLANGLRVTNEEKCKPQVEGLNATAPAFFTHISKCAGTSAKKVLWALLPQLQHGETCYLLDDKTASGVINIAFLRSPRHQVLSQYLECAYDNWGRNVTLGYNLPYNEGDFYVAFAEWVDFFADPHWNSNKGDFNCYNPRNFMARSLTCTNKWCGNHNQYHCNSMHHVGPGMGGSKEEVPALNKALRSVRTIDLVGISELFEESMCVFEYRITGRLGKGCTCEEPLPYSPHVSHHVPPHDINNVTRNPVEPVGPLVDLARSFQVPSDAIEKGVGDMSIDTEAMITKMTPSTLQQVDGITGIDSQVYAAAVRRFLCDLRAIEGNSGQCLLRQDRLAALRQTSRYLKSYLDGLFEDA